MKDLKHYFSSPKVNGEITQASRTVSDLNESINVQEEEVAPKEKLKKKKRKRKVSDSDVSMVDLFEEEEEESIKKKKKRKKSGAAPKVKIGEKLEVVKSEEGEETPKGSKRSKASSSSSKKSRDSGSSKENSILSDAEDKTCTLSDTPDNSKNLFSYFNRVEKLPEIIEKPKIIKVQAIVHADISGSPPSDVSGKTPSFKKRKSTKKKSVVDFDLITTEEIIQVEDLCDSRLPIDTNDIKPDLECSANGSHVNILKEVDVCESSKDLNHNGSLGTSDDKPRRSSRSLQVKSIENGNEENIPSSSSTKRERKCNGKKENVNHIDLNSACEKTLKSKDTVDSESDNGPIVIIEDESPMRKSKLKHDGTLASFFNLGSKQLTSSQEKNTSKLQFLLSGAPPCAKRLASTTTPSGTIASFPSKSHLQQKDKMNILWNLNPIDLKLKPVAHDTFVTPAWHSLSQENKDINHTIPRESKKFELKNCLKDLKKELNLFPISCWVKELKKMKKGNEILMWTERYRPHSSSEFLANARSISKLKSWLTELKESSVGETDASSSDEFVKDTDQEHVSERKTVILLTGPPGTGKTASVYAIAEEIGYNVLELNASSNRSGKRILNEFSEALQSHKVRVAKLNFSKAKKKTEEPQRNLILIEDADLLFDDDEGFVPTLVNLGASTKRPIILVANNSQAKHFGKLTSLFHSTLQFVPPTQDRLDSWLRTVSAIEGFKLDPEVSKRLASSQDLRRCLLQLQLTQSSVQGCRDESDLETSVWNSASGLDFRSKLERKKALRIMAGLCGLDVIRHKRGRDVVAYWRKELEDSTLNLECQMEPSQRLDSIEASLLGLLSHSDSGGSEARTDFNIPINLLEIEKDACSMTSILNRRSLALDYWSALRQMSRSETARLATHTKRNNRYFNYLSSLGLKGPPDFFQFLSSSFS